MDSAEQRRSLGLMRPILIWLALFVSASIVIFGRNLVGALKVLRNTAATQGQVIALLPEAHRSVEIAYEVEGRRYITSTSLPDKLGLPPFEELRIGNSVRVEYNPKFPEHGIPGSASALVKSDFVDIGMIGLFLIAVTGLLEFRIRRRDGAR